MLEYDLLYLPIYVQSNGGCGLVRQVKCKRLVGVR